MYTVIKCLGNDKIADRRKIQNFRPQVPNTTVVTKPRVSNEEEG